MATSRVADLFARVSPQRLEDLTLELVSIPSPTGDSLAVTEFYADYVRSLGIPIEVLREYPSSPSTVARLGGRAGGRSLALDGHLDTIHAAHPEPCVDGKSIYGRGAGDMKSGIAAFLEATRILVESGTQLDGDLVLVTHSLHEAPVGHMEGLRSLIARGDVFVDAALVAECGFDSLHVSGKGQTIFNFEICREGQVLHENVARPRGVPNPLDYATRLASRLLERDAELASDTHPLLGPETFFLGEIRGGDFYNRVPTRASVVGIHRFWPDKEWSDIDDRFDGLLASVDRHRDLTVKMNLAGNGLGYEVDPGAAIVDSLRGAYRDVVGREIPLVGGLSVSDVNVIAREGGIPVVAHGTGSTTAHADLEWVDVDNIVRTTKVFLATIVDYLGVRA